VSIVVISGGFDPLHIGHLDYINEARELGNKLIVLVNTDAWLTRKKGKPFMTASERGEIVGSIEGVDEVYLADDADGTVVASLRKIREGRPESLIVFANGGDRLPTNTPETTYCLEQGIIMAFNVGGKKKQSSSELLKKSGSVRYAE
jgi:cytidyltransferase-like protein